MSIPLRASVRLLAVLTLACFTAALPQRLAAQTAAAPQPSSPSPNGKIVYHSDQAGDPGVNDIYTMDESGRHETRLTNNTANDSNPVWSPQGNQIAFLSNRRGVGHEIFLMNADGSSQRPLRSTSPVYTTSTPDWSPDGTRLKYETGGDIYVIEAVAPGGGDSTAAPVNVSAGKPAGSLDRNAGWSPAGDRLVLSNALDCGGCSDLYIVNADGTGRTQLTSGPGFDANPRWSPDGNFVAYEADRGGRALFVIDAQGIGPERKLSGGFGSWGAPSWSPDGSRIAYASLTGGLQVVNVDGTGAAPLTDLAGSSSGPFWSPDGQKVAFHNGGDIHVINADGTSRRALNYTKTRRADEAATSWQRVPVQ